MNPFPVPSAEAPPSVELLCDALEAFAAGRLPDLPALEEVEHVLESLVPRIGSERRKRRAVARVLELIASGECLSERAAAQRAQREGLGREETIRQWVRQSRVPTRP